MNNKRIKKYYSALEKKAYYTGLGVGLTGQGPRGNRLTQRAVAMMSDSELDSYIAGFERGQENSTVLSGVRNKKKWF